MTESQLVHDIIHELGKHGAAFRTNAGTVKTEQGGKFQGLPRGFSDILFVHPKYGTSFIEVKLPTGKLSEHQRYFLDRMKSLNARAGVAHSVSEALNLAGITLEDLL